MPRSGGIYTLPPGYFATDGTTIEVSQHNPPLEDVAQALTDSLPRDGSAPMTGNLPMGSNKITGLAAATNPGDAVRFDQVTSSAFLSSASALSLLADEMIYASGTNIAAKTALTAFARQILDDANAAAVRTTIDAQEDVMTTRGDLVTRDASTTVRLPLGASGTVLTSDGTDVTWAAASGGGDYQAFTADGTWTKPAGIDADTMVWVELWGGGSSGRRNATDHPGGGGGGYVRAAFRAGDLGATVAVTIGLGGAASAGNGLAGGSTTFGTHLGASGGGTVTGATGGAGGTVNLVDKAIAKFVFAEAGGSGGAAGVVGTSTITSGAGGGGGAAVAILGGTSFNGGNGGAGGDGTPAPTAGTAPGGAGGGGFNVNSGAGANGEVRVWIG